MYSKKNNNGAIVAIFSPYRYEVNEKSLFLTKNPKINQFVVKISFGIQLQTFP